MQTVPNYRIFKNLIFEGRLLTLRLSFDTLYKHPAISFAPMYQKNEIGKEETFGRGHTMLM